MTGIEKKAVICILDLYRSGRKRLLEDTKKKASALYLGMHSMKKAERENYFDRYLILWQLNHCEMFQEVLKRTEEKSLYQFVFGKSYLTFLAYDGCLFHDARIAVEMMKSYKNILENMITTSLSWDEGYDRLCVEKKKQEEKFLRLRNQMEKGECV